MNKALNDQKHVPVLDSLRGLAAMSVCLYHFVCTTTGFIHHKGVLAVFENGQLGVQMFFIISGFVIPWSLYHAGYRIHDFFRFLLKRFIRLEPPYVASIFIAIGLLVVKNYVPGTGTPEPLPSLTRILLHFGYLIPFVEGFKWLNNVYWTLAIEFQYYLSVGLLFFLLVNGSVYLRMIFYLLMFSAQFIGNHDFLPFWLPVFLLGILLFLYFSGRIQPVEFTLLSLSALFCVFWRIGIPSGITCIITVGAILFFTNASGRLTRFFGDISYSVYLIHPLLGASVVNVLSHHVHSALMKGMVVLLGVVVTIISAWIMYLVVERPSRSWSSRIKFRRT